MFILLADVVTCQNTLHGSGAAEGGHSTDSTAVCLNEWTQSAAVSHNFCTKCLKKPCLGLSLVSCVVLFWSSFSCLPVCSLLWWPHMSHLCVVAPPVSRFSLVWLSSAFLIVHLVFPALCSLHVLCFSCRFHKKYFHSLFRFLCQWCQYLGPACNPYGGKQDTGGAVSVIMHVFTVKAYVNLWTHPFTFAYTALTPLCVVITEPFYRNNQWWPGGDSRLGRAGHSWLSHLHLMTGCSVETQALRSTLTNNNCEVCQSA